ncbi:hypothetical protein [Halosegnis longus]
MSRSQTTAIAWISPDRGVRDRSRPVMFQKTCGEVYMNATS